MERERVTTHRVLGLRWVVLTMGNRPAELERAVASLAPDPVTIVANGVSDADVPVDGNRTGELVRAVQLPENLGVPGGRDEGVRAFDEGDLVGFLDDDAELRGDAMRIVNAFAGDDTVGAVALRLVDEDGHSARRHVPRLGGHDPEPGDVALFLGGACAIRRTAYDEVGGYFTDLFYGHEEVELCWRLVDAGWKIRYLADVEVFHPRTTIERHADGWELTGRNRVMVARRTLPWPVALIHVTAWLGIGAWRAPKGESRRRYIAGWRRGWRMSVDRSPISWRGVLRLTRLGRPPIV